MKGQFAFINLAGTRRGRLAVIERTVRSRAGYWKWKCVCDCGTEIELESYRITRGDTRSCGCLRKELLPFANRKHGLYGKAGYKTWEGLKSRCTDPTAKDYHNYGGRGIRVCAAILESPLPIIHAIGPRPSGLSIDRVDNEGHYSCGQCGDCIVNGWRMNLRWATAKGQGRNRRTNRLITIGAVTKCLAQWAEDTGLTSLAIRQRISRGWPESKWLIPSLH